MRRDVGWTVRRKETLGEFRYRTLDSQYRDNFRANRRPRHAPEREDTEGALLPPMLQIGFNTAIWQLCPASFGRIIRCLVSHGWPF